MTPATHQQQVYEAAYETVDGDYGLPDRRLTPSKRLHESKILNLGGGAANDLWFLTETNSVVNVDYATSGLQAGARHGVRGVAVDLNLVPSLPFANRAFDLVVCKDILEHLLDPLTVLQDARRTLQDDGEIVISVPNHFYWPMRVRLLFGKGIIWRGLLSDHGALYSEWNYMHIRFFTYRGFRQFLDAAGLRPVKFYWDFGNLAYYYNPDMWLEPQIQKRALGTALSPRAKFGLYIVRPLWKLFNFLFPRPLRSAVVSLCPGLLCGGFYVRCRKEPGGRATIEAI